MIFRIYNLYTNYEKVSYYFDAIAGICQFFAQLKQYNITDYGTVANTLSTKALQAAIDACNGGGDGVVPTGVFFMGAVHLKSNVHLYLQSGTILRSSTNLNGAPNNANTYPAVLKNREGFESDL